ncbi:MAG: hypothetical protein Q8J60_05175 [Thiobacillus sp.]|nr:hypothetical protein [Thiobacillus sp.]
MRLAFANKKRATRRVFYWPNQLTNQIVSPRNACHHRLRWPVTTPLISSSRGGVRLITQPGSTDDFTELDPHELPR